VRKLWQMLGSVRLAVLLLVALLLALLLDGLGLLPLPHSPLFPALLVLQALSTFFCTLQRLPGLWRALHDPLDIVQPDAFYASFPRRAEWPIARRGDGLIAARSTLARHRYQTYIKRDEAEQCTYLCAERNRFSHAATLISHIAALALIVIVAARPALSWQEQGVILLPGQPQRVGPERRTEVMTGPLSVVTYPDGAVRNYRIALLQLQDGEPVAARMVSINRPATLGGLTFHLLGQGPLAELTTPAGTRRLALTWDQPQEVTLPDGGPSLRLTYHSQPEGLLVEVLDPAGGPGPLLVRDGQEIEIAGQPITVTLERYTVWQVSRDPTFPLVLGAAALLLLGIVISLWLPHLRLWLRLTDRQAEMVGRGGYSGEFEMLVGEMARVYHPGPRAGPRPEGEATDEQ